MGGSIGMSGVSSQAFPMEGSSAAGLPVTTLPAPPTTLPAPFALGSRAVRWSQEQAGCREDAVSRFLSLEQY